MKKWHTLISNASIALGLGMIQLYAEPQQPFFEIAPAHSYEFKFDQISGERPKMEKWYLSWNPNQLQFGKSLWGRTVFDFSVQHLVETKGVFMSETFFDIPVDLRFDTQNKGLSTDFHVDFEK